MDTVAFLAYPFLACILLILIHTYFGIHVLERGIIFVDLALAQFIGIGMAFAYILGYDKGGGFLLSLVFALLGAVVLSFSRRIARLANIEAFIGVIYIFSLGVVILILDLSPHGSEEFKNILNGNILWVGGWELGVTALLYAAIGLVHFFFRGRFFALSLRGEGSFFWEFLFFFSFAVVLVKSVQLAGILQVFSFLIIPALTGRLFTTDPIRLLLAGWLLGFLASVLGIAASYRWDLPTSPLIVVSLSMMFFGALLMKGLCGMLCNRKNSDRRGVT
jgi:zinc/manganese transport system permease protein